MRMLFFIILIGIISSASAQDSKYSCEEELQLTNKNVARYYMLEAQNALNWNDSRLAYLLTKAALEKDSTNVQAQQIHDTILPFLSNLSYHDALLFQQYPREENTWNPDSTVFLFFSDFNQKDTTATLHFFQLDSTNNITSFKNHKRDINREGFTQNGKYFWYFTKNQNNQSGFHLIEIKNPTRGFHFKNKSGFGGPTNDPDEFLVYLEKSPQNTLQLISLKQPDKILASYKGVEDYYFGIYNNYLYFYTNVKEDGIGILNLVNLKNPKRILTFPNTYVYYPDLIPNKYFVFFDKQDKDRQTFNLNLVNINKPNKRITFPDTYDIYEFDRTYSRDGKYLIYFTDVIKETGTLHLVDLEKLNKQWQFQDCYINSKTFEFSPDNHFFVFLSNNKDSGKVLNLINIHKPDQLISFEHAYLDNSFKFHRGSRYFTFFTDVKDYFGTLHVMDLRNFAKHDTYPNVRYQSEYFSANHNFLAFNAKDLNGNGTVNLLNLKSPDSMIVYQTRNRYGTDFKFSNDSQYFLFHAETDSKTKMGTLNLIKLSDDYQRFIYPNSYQSYFSNNSKYLVFSSDLESSGYNYVIDGKGTLNLIYLETPEKRFSFPKSATKDISFSLDDKLLIFAASGEKDLNIWNCQEEKMEQVYKNKDKIEYYTISKDNRWLLILTSYDNTLKIIDLSLRPEAQRAYYDSILHFTEAERSYYGIDE